MRLEDENEYKEGLKSFKRSWAEQSVKSKLLKHSLSRKHQLRTKIWAPMSASELERQWAANYTG